MSVEAALRELWDRIMALENSDIVVATFKSDATIVPRRFFSDAVVQKSQIFGLTSDAVVFGSQAAWFTADGVSLRAQGGSFTADAFIQGWFTADAITEKEAAGSFTADAWLDEDGFGWFNVDAVIV